MTATALRPGLRAELEQISKAHNPEFLDYLALRVLDDVADRLATDPLDHVRAIRAAVAVRRAELRDLAVFQVDALAVYFNEQRRASLDAHKPLVGEDPLLPPARPRSTGRHTVVPFVRGSAQVLDPDLRPVALSANAVDAWTVAGALDEIGAHS